jgi:uncharacterized protein YjhX (UPF0386 family)
MTPANPHSTAREDGQTTRCSFPLAIVKGLIEHQDGTAYFGSTMGYGEHLRQTIEAGLVESPDGRPTRVTERGRQEYEREGLAQLPTRKLSRAYMWDWKTPRNTEPSARA